MADNSTGPHTWGPEDRIVGGNILRPSDNTLFSLPRHDAAAFSGLYNFKIVSAGDELDEVVPVASLDMKQRWLQYDTERLNANERAGRIVRAAADTIKTWYMRGEILRIPESAYRSILRLFFPSFLLGGHIGSLEYSGGMVFSSTGEAGEGTYGYLAGDSIYSAYSVQSPQTVVLGVRGYGYSTPFPSLYLGTTNYGYGGYATATLLRSGESYVGRQALICPYAANVSLPIAHTSPVVPVSLRYDPVKRAFVHTVAYVGMASSSRPVTGSADVEYLYAYNNGTKLVYANDRYSVTMQADNNAVPVSVIDTYEKVVPEYALGHEVPAVIEIDIDPYTIPEAVRRNRIRCVCNFSVMGRYYTISGEVLLDTGKMETEAYGSAEEENEPAFGILYIDKGTLELAADSTAAVLLEVHEETVIPAGDAYYFKAAKKIAVNLSAFLNTHAKRVCVTNSTEEVRTKVASRTAEGALHNYSSANRSALLSRGMMRNLVGMQSTSAALAGEFKYITTGEYSAFWLGTDCSKYTKVGSRMVGSGSAVQFLSPWSQDIYPPVYRKDYCAFTAAGEMVALPVAYCSPHGVSGFGDSQSLFLKPSAGVSLVSSLVDKEVPGTPFGRNHTATATLAIPTEYYSLFSLFECDAGAATSHRAVLHTGAHRRVIAEYASSMYFPVLTRGAGTCLLSRMEDTPGIYITDNVSFSVEVLQAYSVALDSRLGTLIKKETVATLKLPETTTTGSAPAGTDNPSTACTFVTYPVQLTYAIVSAAGALVTLGKAGCSAHIAPLATAASLSTETPEYLPDAPFTVNVAGTRSRITYSGMAATPLSYGLLAYAGSGTVRATPSGKVMAIDLGAVIHDGVVVLTGVEPSDYIEEDAYANRLSSWLIYPCPYYYTRYSFLNIPIDNKLVLSQVDAIPTGYEGFTLTGRGGIANASTTSGTYQSYLIQNYLAVTPLNKRDASANTFVVATNGINNYHLQVERLQRCAGRTRRFLYTVVQGWVDNTMLLHIQKRGPTRFIDVSFPIPAYGAVAAASFSSRGVYDVRNNEDKTTRTVSGSVSCVETLRILPNMSETLVGMENRYSQIYDGKEKCVVLMLASSDPMFQGEFCAVVPASLASMVQVLSYGITDYDVFLGVVQENIDYMNEMNALADKDQTTGLLTGWSYAGIDYLQNVRREVSNEKEHADMQEVPFDFATSLYRHTILKAWDGARVVLNDFVSKRLFAYLLAQGITGGIITTTKSKAKEPIVLMVYRPVPKPVP